MQPVGPIDVLALFPEERAALVDLLSSLDDGGWSSPTVCDGWSVKDLAGHVIGDDIGVLSRGRDGHRWWQADPPAYADLVAAINSENESWVRAMRRCSPRVVLDLLRQSGEWALAHFRLLNAHAIGGPVSWAGPQPAPVWLDVAREYTERWAHQQQIRDAVARPGLKDARHFAPVLDTYVRALPHTYRDLIRDDGTVVELLITGEAGGTWSLRCESGDWTLYTGSDGDAAASVTIDQDRAWRLMTNGLSRAEAEGAVTIQGDRGLGERALEIVSIIA